MKSIKAAIDNPVAMNLIMVVLMLWGVLSYFTIPREIFPEFEFDVLRVTMVYPGATPDEVEESITTKIEEAISQIAGIENISSTSSEGSANVVIELDPDYSAQKIKDEVESQVNQITTFPRDAEKANIVQITRKTPAILIGLFGDMSEEALKEYADQIRDEILQLSGITLVDYMDEKEREISIELSDEKLAMYGLNFQQVAQAIRNDSINLPGGSIRTQNGEVMVRTVNQKYTGDEFAKIIIKQGPLGSRIRLGDVAQIRDSFKDESRLSQMDGKTSHVLRVYKTGSQDIIKISDTIKEYVANKKNPPSIEMFTWGDRSRMVKGRLELMERNGYSGLVLVFLGLTLFLQMKLAFFVALGIPISFLGTFVIMNMVGATFNMISLFAMILVLGIVVDDAVVIGESIFSEMKKGKKPTQAALDGAMSVFWPVIASVFTTIIAFLPLAFVDGAMGKFFEIVPVVVVCALLFSLFESLYILPGHLAHHVRELDAQNPLERLQKGLQRVMQTMVNWFIHRVYLKTAALILRYRYATVGAAIALLIFSLGLLAGGRVQFNFFPKTDQDVVVALYEFAPGTDFQHTKNVSEHILKKLYETQTQMEKEAKEKGLDRKFPFVKHIFTSLNAHTGRIQLELEPAEDRNIFYMEILKRWRENVGQIPEAISQRFEAQRHGPGGGGLEIQLRGRSYETMEKAAEILREELATYPFVSDIYDNFRDGKLEARIELKPQARLLNLSLGDVASQVRQAFYGEQALRIQRGQDDIRVYVRYPREARETLNTSKELKIRTSSSQEIPFSEVARFNFQRGFSQIYHTDRARQVTVTADVDAKKGSSSELIEDLIKRVFPRIKALYPDLNFVFKGSEEERQKSLGSLFVGFLIALFAIYTILATIFKSYMQPMIIMLAIPFGFIGAVFGHMLMGMKLTIMSMFGLVALAGIVVNNSLLLIEYINRGVRSGNPLLKSVILAGKQRFMAIFLTSVTTCLGVTPMLYEKSIQAQFLQPCVISLAFGLLMSTVFTLLLIPSMYVILYDILRFFKRVYTGRWVKHEELI